jgi:ATP-binding cassette subfamily F protein 3
LTNYPGTILFITHDRYLTEKIATHLLYLEDGKPYVFDRLSAFEEWLSNPPIESKSAAVPRTPEKAVASGMSKNRREKLQAEISRLEAQIAGSEVELASLEASFQNPDPQSDWEATHKRYAELKASLDGLYGELAAKLDLVG